MASTVAAAARTYEQKHKAQPAARIDGFPARLLQSLLSCLTLHGHMLLDLEHLEQSATERLPDLLVAGCERVFGLAVYALICDEHTLPTALFNYKAEDNLGNASSLDQKTAYSSEEYVTYAPESPVDLNTITSANSAKNARAIDAKAVLQLDKSYATKGPIFHNIVLLHRLDRAPASTQAVILQAMKCKNISIDGTLHRMPRTHVILGTFSRRASSSESLLISDRLARSCVLVLVAEKNLGSLLQAYLHKQTRLQQERMNTDPDTSSVKEAEAAEDEGPDGDGVKLFDWRVIRTQVPSVYVALMIEQYIRDIISALSQHSAILVGPGLEAQHSFLNLARMHALFSGVNFVRPIDVAGVCLNALTHHISLYKPVNTRRFHDGAQVDYQHRARIRDIIQHLVFKVIKPSKD